MELTSMIRKTSRDDISAYFICALVFALPFTTHLLSYGVILAFIATLLQTNFKQKFLKVLRDKGFLLIVAFYLLHLLGLLYTKNLNQGLLNLQIKLTLVLIPFIVFVSSISIGKHLKLIATAFVAGNLVAGIICLIISITISFQTGNFNPSIYPGYSAWSFFKLLASGYTHFNYSFLSHFIHVNYFSMYLLLATYIVYRELIDNWPKLGAGEKIVLLTLVAFFLIILLLLQSRAAILSFLVIILIEIVFFLRKSGYLGAKITVITLISAILFLTIFKSGRFLRITESAQEFNYEKLKAKELRISLWETSFSLIRLYPLIGVGTGDVKDELSNIYDEKLKENSKGKYYDAHNEFLQTTMRLGLMGTIALFLLIFWPLMDRNVYRTRPKYVLFFIIIVIVNFSFESMLNRFNGVIFFSLFYSVLASQNLIIKKDF